MEWIFDNERPIYKQLVEQLTVRILTGVYQRNEKLPSVRDLAFDTKVNPNTMQRALAELELAGLVYSKRTSGRYVTDSEQIFHQVREEMAKDIVISFLTSMNNLGTPKEELAIYLEKYGEELKK